MNIDHNAANQIAYHLREIARLLPGVAHPDLNLVIDETVCLDLAHLMAELAQEESS